ncbi:hypothetical protein [Paenibacillus sp. FSL L8-0463]|uniref:hypothetical protein n=1 Tax=Paenibacillus sp. FSL L8-0463 TaxID=2954687 RepID=UPI0031192037
MGSMKDTRKNIKAAPAVKADLNAVQRQLGFKTESQTIAYLTAMYWSMKSRKITLDDHLNYLNASEEASL